MPIFSIVFSRISCLWVSPFFLLIIMIAGSEAVGMTATATAETATAVKPKLVAATSTINHALLVGCTKYAHPNISELSSAPNDIPLWNELLVTRFGFPKKNIRCLLRGHTTSVGNPTYANIVREFKHLIATAKPESQIVILLSGHGTQTPIPASQKNPYDPRNPEEDGLDEIFLPEDAAKWSKGELKNVIKDDQIGQWIDQLRQRGAHVWLIFDCCHAGTMAKGNRRTKHVPATALGIPNRLIQQAKQRAKLAKVPTVPAIEIQKTKKQPAGSFTAFYAAQPFEEALEMKLPVGENNAQWRSLFTFTLLKALNATTGKSSLTYRDLGRSIVRQIRANPSCIYSPTPSFTGDTNRFVLGKKVWPAANGFTIDRNGNRWEVSGGLLRGLTRGTILAKIKTGQQGKTQNEKKTDAPLFFKVTTTTASKAVAVPCDAKGGLLKTTPTVAATDRFAIISQETGDLRIRIFVEGKTVLARNIVQSFKNPKTAAHRLVQICKPENAQWKLRIGKQSLELSRHQKKVADTAGRTIPAIGNQIHQRYTVKSVDDLSKEFIPSLRKIYAWQNVWRVAHMTTSGDTDEFQAFRFQMSKIKKWGDPTSGAPLNDSTIRVGQHLRLDIENKDIAEGLWVVVVLLNAKLGIHVLDAKQVGPNRSLKPWEFQLNGKSLGVEGIVAFAFPMGEQPNRPNLKFLNQTNFGEKSVAKGVLPKPKTAFEQLLQHAMSGAVSKSSHQPAAIANPIVHSQSWITLPEKRK